jgi:hypothetical protein
MQTSYGYDIPYQAPFEDLSPDDSEYLAGGHIWE